MGQAMALAWTLQGSVDTDRVVSGGAPNRWVPATVTNRSWCDIHVASQPREIITDSHPVSRMSHLGVQTQRYNGHLAIPIVACELHMLGISVRHPDPTYLGWEPSATPCPDLRGNDRVGNAT